MDGLRTDLANDEARLCAWIEKNLSGEIIYFKRDVRWRPAWEVDLREDGRVVQLYVRGERTAGLETQPLEREFEVLSLLEKRGVAVPHIFGWCPNPKAIVMQRINGSPYVGGAETNSDLRSAAEQYMVHLARIHNIPSEEAVAIGLPGPSDTEEIDLGYFKGIENHYLEDKTRPEPLLEFVRLWLKRNIPRRRYRPALITGDAPQFFHQGGKFLALFDLELAHIGDPLRDLASMRLRDMMEPTGTLSDLFAIYSQATGEHIDVAVLNYYTIAQIVCVPMNGTSTLRKPEMHPAYAEYLSWNLSTTPAVMQAMAQFLGIDLEPVVSVEGTQSRRHDVFAALVLACEALPLAEGHYREHPALSLARFALRADEIGGTLDALELQEAEKILGRSLRDLDEVEAELEKMVRTAGPERDEELIRFFYRRESRRLQTLQDYPSPIVHRGLAPINFPKVAPER